MTNEATTATNGTPGRMPAVYLGHGAPPLLDDRLWVAQLKQWACDLPRPESILVMSAHWENAPLAVGATTTVPLIYDFYGFPKRYYDMTYAAPGAPELADSIAGLLPFGQPLYQDPNRGLDHGAFVPLMVMYPEEDIPVLQISLPTNDPKGLLELGQRLAPLRDEGVLIMGSGFMTHNLRGLDWNSDKAPAWSAEFDHWVAETIANNDIDALLDYKAKAPAARVAHPTTEHFDPIFTVLGAAGVEPSNIDTPIDGFWHGLSKRSLQVA
jgi:4,5-DOPA dioxygenase extradiol